MYAFQGHALLLRSDVMSARFLEKRFVIVAGKGGVGKSTVCAALGLAAARAGRKTIITELNTQEKIPHLFGKPANGPRPGEVAPNLYSLNIQPEPALHEYAIRKIRFERIYKAVFEQEAVKRLLRMLPGATELLLLGKAYDLERDRDARGKPDWDMVIVDAPATGHGVSLLRLPQTLLDVVPSGPMADEARGMRDLLTDPERTMIQVVALPEEMPVRETFDLLHQIETVLRIPKGFLFINGVWPEVADAEVVETMARVAEVSGASDPVIAGAMSCLTAQVQRRSFQAPYIEELRAGIEMPIIELPFLFRREFAQEAIETLSQHCIEAIETIEADAT
jgi:anion-transporting  ArsA/GET3 family ATPase